jgi:hypothetical protein
VNPKAAGDFGWRDSLLKQLHGFQLAFLKCGLINGSVQGHAGNTLGNRDLALLSASRNNGRANVSLGIVFKLRNHKHLHFRCSIPTAVFMLIDTDENFPQHTLRNSSEEGR